MHPCTLAIFFAGLLGWCSIGVIVLRTACVARTSTMTMRMKNYLITSTLFIVVVVQHACGFNAMAIRLTAHGWWCSGQLQVEFHLLTPSGVL